MQHVALQGASWQHAGDGIQADLGQIAGLSSYYHQKIVANHAYRDQEEL